MPVIHFQGTVYTIGSWAILRLPNAASAQLPSRGQTMVKGVINGFPFQAPLEPDGRGSHWLHVTKDIQASADVKPGDTVTAEIESTRKWPEPTVPADLMKAISADSRLQHLWMDITPMARWEWIRWIGSTNQPETRTRRVEVTCSKLMAGERRPCCFNRNVCCVPEVSKNGVLLEPS